MTKVKNLLEWLSTMNQENDIGIDEGGLCLVEIQDGKRTLNYAEIGGIPNDYDQTTIQPDQA